VKAAQGALLLGGEVTTLTSRDTSSASVLPLTLPKANSSSDQGKTPRGLGLPRPSRVHRVLPIRPGHESDWPRGGRFGPLWSGAVRTCEQTPW